MVRANIVVFVGILIITVAIFATSSLNSALPACAGITPPLLCENEMPAYILKHSQVPSFKDSTDAYQWRDMLTRLAARISGTSFPLWGTLIVAEGAGADGYYWVFLRASNLASFNLTVASTVISFIDDNSVSIGWVPDVPVKFALATGNLSLNARHFST